MKISKCIKFFWLKWTSKHSSVIHQTHKDIREWGRCQILENVKHVHFFSPKNSPELAVDEIFPENFETCFLFMLRCIQSLSIKAFFARSWKIVFSRGKPMYKIRTLFNGSFCVQTYNVWESCHIVTTLHNCPFYERHKRKYEYSRNET